VKEGVEDARVRAGRGSEEGQEKGFSSKREREGAASEDTDKA
jgi:hypothetical protein